MYLDTLRIGRKTMDVALKKINHGIYSGAVKHVLGNKTTDKSGYYSGIYQHFSIG